MRKERVSESERGVTRERDQERGDGRRKRERRTITRSGVRTRRKGRDVFYGIYFRLIEKY